MRSTPEHMPSPTAADTAPFEEDKNNENPASPTTKELQAIADQTLDSDPLIEETTPKPEDSASEFPPPQHPHETNLQKYFREVRQTGALLTKAEQLELGKKIQAGLQGFLQAGMHILKSTTTTTATVERVETWMANFKKSPLAVEEVITLLETEVERVMAEMKTGTKISEAKAISLTKMQISKASMQEGMQKMVEKNLRLVISIAKKFHHTGLSSEDLIQEGNMGLMRAALRFDPEFKFKFSPFATWWITQGIFRAIRNQGETIRTPIHHGDSWARLRKIMNMAEKITGITDHHQLLEMAASEMGITPKQAREIWESRKPTTSLNSPVGDDDADLEDFLRDTSLTGELAQNPEEQILETDFAEKIMAAMASSELSDRERQILEMRMGLPDDNEHTLEEVAAVFGITRERIRQLQDKALKKLSRTPAMKQLLRDEGGDRNPPSTLMDPEARQARNAEIWKLRMGKDGQPPLGPTALAKKFGMKSVHFFLAKMAKEKGVTPPPLKVAQKKQQPAPRPGWATPPMKSISAADLNSGELSSAQERILKEETAKMAVRKEEEAQKTTQAAAQKEEGNANWQKNHGGQTFEQSMGKGGTRKNKNSSSEIPARNAEIWKLRMGKDGQPPLGPSALAKMFEMSPNGMGNLLARMAKQTGINLPDLRKGKRTPREKIPVSVISKEEQVEKNKADLMRDLKSFLKGEELRGEITLEPSSESELSLQDETFGEIIEAKKIMKELKQIGKLSSSDISDMAELIGEGRKGVTQAIPNGEKM